MSKVWHVSLDPSSITDCINGLMEYQRKIPEKCERLRQRVAELIAREAQRGFTGAVSDSLTALSGPPRIANVNVTVDRESENVTLVIAHGEDAVWVEFGAGVHYNGAPGGSKNPLVAQNGLGFAIGGYGKNGVKEKWAFTEGGRTLWSYGTPTGMPLYKAIMSAKDQIVRIAKEVFADD